MYVSFDFSFMLRLFIPLNWGSANIFIAVQHIGNYVSIALCGRGAHSAFILIFQAHFLEKIINFSSLIIHLHKIKL